MNRDEGEMKARAKDAISRLVAELFERISDMYFGSSEPLKMSWGWRFLYAVSGSIILYFMLIILHPNLPVFEFIRGMLLLLLPCLAIMAEGIKRGGPIRFFLMGFLLYPFLSNIASWFFLMGQYLSALLLGIVSGMTR